MSRRMNLARLLTSLRHRGNDIARRRSHLRGCRFHQPLTTYCYCKYPNQWTNHNLVSTAFSRNPRAQIRESQTMGSIDEEKEEEERKDGFLVDARETILMLMRIGIVTSIIITLLAAYLIMRMTHASSFPIILRKGSLVIC